jgi:GDP-L-fucose synthase
VDDLADACVFILEYYTGESHLNAGSGQEITIADLAKLIAEIVHYEGKLIFDRSRPDGMPRKLLDSSELFEMGWWPRTGLREGLERAYSEFLAGNYRVQ